MPRRRKGPFKGKGGHAAPAPFYRSAAANPSSDGGRRSPVQGWTLIGDIAVRTTDLSRAVRAARDLRGTRSPAGCCRIDGLDLRWMRLPQFYRHIGALP